jgi:hypothetical protein
VQQVLLKGRDLRSAWSQNRITSSWRPADNTFSPHKPGGPMVFHGTNTRSLTGANIDDLCTGKIRLFAGGRNQMAPWGVFHTSFWGIRSFLWAVFSQNVVAPIPEGSARLNLNSTFQFDGNEYRGILLLAFYTQTPSPPGLNAEILDGGILQWSGACTENFRPGFVSTDERDQYWRTLASLHRKQGSSWPDILHAPEDPNPVNIISPLQRGCGPSTVNRTILEECLLYGKCGRASTWESRRSVRHSLRTRGV